MPRSPIRYLVRLQGKLQLSKRGEKYLHIRKFVLRVYCPIFQCTSHQPISVADLGWRVNNAKPLLSSCLHFFLITPWKGGGAAARQPLPPPFWVGQWCCNLSSDNWQYLYCDWRSTCYLLITALYHLIYCWLNPLKAELNPICYLLALLGAHHFLHVSRIRVKSLTLRQLMSYVYGAPILDVSRSHTGERPAAAHLLRSWVRIPTGAWIFVCCECRVLSGRGLCDELITRPEESYRLCCVVVCDLETSRIGAPYIYIYIYIYIHIYIYMTLVA